MRIVILGAGQVGGNLAENLVAENYDVTVVDRDRELLAQLQDRLDLQTVAGNAAHPSVLANAGLNDADLMISVTRSDQTNLVACKIAHSLFNVPTRIARLRATDFQDNEKLLSKENFAVDYALCPEQIITEHLARLVDFPEALQVLTFGGGRLALVGVRAQSGGKLIGRRISQMGSDLPAGVDGRIAAIYRRDMAILPTGETVINHGDEVFALAAEEHIRVVMRELRRSIEPVQRVMIAGAGNVGLRLARALERKCQVKVVELDQRRAEAVADSLKSVLVLRGDATDQNVLTQESIEAMDLFLALTNRDEDNIMAATLAKRMGCKRVVALINRRAYAELVQGGPIDIAISPAQLSISALLTYVRRGDVAQVHSLRHGAAEAFEIVAHGDEKNSKVIGRRIRELPAINGAFIAAIMRDGERHEGAAPPGLARQKRIGPVLIAHKDAVIEPEDHVLVFCVDKKVVRQVEKLFAFGFYFV